MKDMFRVFSLGIILTVVCSFTSFSQSKKPIDHSDYDGWKGLKNQIISNNGEFVAYEINPQKGDGVLNLYEGRSSTYLNFQRGYKPDFSANSNFIVFKIKPQFDTVRSQKLKKVKKDKLPTDSAGIYVFKSKVLLKYPKLKSFVVPEKESDWVAIFLEMKEPKKKEVDSISEDKKESKNQNKKKKDKKKEKQHLLVLLNPITGDSVGFEDVSKFAFAHNGETCAFIQPKKDSIDSVMVSIFRTSTMTVETIIDIKGYAESISVDEQGKQFAYTFSTDTAKIKAYDLFYVDLNNKVPESVLSAPTIKTKEDWTVSKKGKIYFNEPGTELYFGLIQRPEPEPEDTLTEDEKVSLDIWNWKDPYLQPHQLKDAKKEKERSYTSVYFPEDKHTIQLGNEDLETIVIDKEAKGHWSLARSNKRYRKLISWNGSRYNDVYLVNRVSGESRMVIEKAASSISLSPHQNFIAWYNITDSSWNVYNIQDQSNKVVSTELEVNFYNELNDVPNEAGPYGMAGWTEDEDLLVYDRYDLWKINPTGKEKPLLLSNGEGRKNKLKFRYKKLDRKERFLPEKLLLTAFNEKNKQAGFYTFDLKKNKLDKLVLSDHFYRSVKKAQDANKLIWQKESCTDYMDLYCSNQYLKKAKRITEVNPQQKDFNWATREIVEWTTFNGDTMQGILIKPEDFDPAKTYPMLVYFYERSSDRLNWHLVPKPSRSIISLTTYPSNGYIIFVPDIKYEIGYPGPSAYDCVVSGTQAMCDRFDFIDRTKLGIQGQSWGGYQTAYIITQTDLYTAAMAGAPVSNMTSAYGGIRWGTGLSRAFQYEETQSRIGATLWERRDLYILNSPLFFVDRINTPLLMMHNDNDGAVPWYQGIEMFNAMRRLDKPAWMLVYNKAPHNLKRRADSEDLDVRMMQFFNHFLKDAPEPVWMKTGIPAIEKGRNFGLETDK